MTMWCLLGCVTSLGLLVFLCLGYAIWLEIKTQERLKNGQDR